MAPPQAMKLFFSIPNILNESSVNQEVRVKNNNKTLAELSGSRTTSQLSLLSIVSGSDAVSHFPTLLPLPLLPKKLPQESNIHILRPLAKIKGEMAIIKERKTGKIFQKQEGTRTMVSTANSNVKPVLSHQM